MSLEQDLKIAEKICQELSQIVNYFNEKIGNNDVTNQDVIAELDDKVRRLSDVIQNQKFEDIEKFGSYADEAKALISGVFNKLETYKASLKAAIEEQGYNIKAHNAYIKATQNVED